VVGVACALPGGYCGGNDIVIVVVTIVPVPGRGSDVARAAAGGALRVEAKAHRWAGRDRLHLSEGQHLYLFGRTRTPPKEKCKDSDVRRAANGESRSDVVRL
jgi:hypothetical protein